MHLYQIGKLIGTGSFGQVFACKHIEQNKYYVAKKMCLAELDEKGKLNIQNQLKLLQNFRHPSIVAFKDSFITQKGLYIIMTYCQAGDLYNRVRNIRDKGKMFPQAQILDWLVQMGLAIYYLHNNRILHRDLKSQNIFIEVTESKQQIIRIGDFGIAKVMDQNQDLTATTAIGSPFYMAPQIFNRNIYSYKSDIWALGCILYQLCNLRTPFDAQSKQGLMMKVMKGSYPSITPTYSKQLRDLIMQMLEKKSPKRPNIVQILNKPFIRYRVQKYIKNKLDKAHKSGMLEQNELYLDMESLKKQAKLLNIDPDNLTGMSRILSLSSMGEDVFLSEQLEEQKEGFIDHKRSSMIDYETMDSNWRGVPMKKKNVILEKIEEQRYNIGRFRITQDYQMGDDQQEVQEALEEIQQQEEEHILHSSSFNLQEQDIHSFSSSKTHLKIYNQLQLLKNTCENALGMHRYIRACHIIERGGNKSQVFEALGEANIGYWHMIQQSMFYQSILRKNHSKSIQN